MAKDTMIPYEKAAQQWRNKPSYRKAYAALEAEYSLYDAMLKAMAESDLTQKEVAKRMGTSEAAVSRLFDVKHAPTWTTITKFAKAVGKQPVLKFV